MKRTLIGMIVALLALAGQALAKDQKPLDLTSFMKPEVSVGAQAMAYAPETTGALPRIQMTPRQKRAVFIRGTFSIAFSYIEVGRAMFEAKGYRVDVCDSFLITSFFCNFEGAEVIVAHSAGGNDAIRAAGAKLVILIDGFVHPGIDQTCLAEKCVLLYNRVPLNSVVGANVEHIDCSVSPRICGLQSQIPGFSHVFMTIDPKVWDVIKTRV